MEQKIPTAEWVPMNFEIMGDLHFLFPPSFLPSFLPSFPVFPLPSLPPTSFLPSLPPFLSFFLPEVELRALAGALPLELNPYVFHMESCILAKAHLRCYSLDLLPMPPT
jgi:hypothetical protein